MQYSLRSQELCVKTKDQYFLFTKRLYTRSVQQNTTSEVLKYGLSLQGPFVKTEGLVIHGISRAVWMINILQYGKTKLLRKVTDNFPKLFKNLF